MRAGTFGNIGEIILEKVIGYLVAGLVVKGKVQGRSIGPVCGN